MKQEKIQRTKASQSKSSNSKLSSVQTSEKKKYQSLLIEKEKELKNLQKMVQQKGEESHKYQLRLERLQLEMNNQKKLFNSSNFYYVSCSNTSSNFQNDFRIVDLWNNFARTGVNAFVDFETNPDIMFHLISEMFLIVIDIVLEIKKKLFQKIASILSMNDNTTLELEKQLHFIVQENLKNIYSSEENKKFLYDNFMKRFESFYNDKINKLNKEFQECISSSGFDNIIFNVRDIILFCEFNKQKLNLQIEKDFDKRKIEMVDTDITPKESFEIFNNKNGKSQKLLVLLKTPLVKNKYKFCENLKTVALIVEDPQFISQNIQNISYVNLGEVSTPFKDSFKEREYCLTENFDTEKSFEENKKLSSETKSISKKLEYSFNKINFKGIQKDHLESHKKENFTNREKAVSKGKLLKKNIVKMVKKESKISFARDKKIAKGNTSVEQLSKKDKKKENMFQLDIVTRNLKSPLTLGSSSTKRRHSKPARRSGGFQMLSSQRSFSKNNTKTSNESKRDSCAYSNVSDISQIMAEGYKQKKRVLIKAEKPFKKIKLISPRENIVSSDTNHNTALTDETLSNSSVFQEYQGTGNSKQKLLIKLSKDRRSKYHQKNSISKNTKNIGKYNYANNVNKK